MRGREGGRDRANIAKMINMLVRGSFLELAESFAYYNHQITSSIKLPANFLLLDIP